MSEVAKIYDPLELLDPVVLTAKTIIQKLWNAKIEWDESVPQHLHTQWKNLCSRLPPLNEVRFPRKVCQNQGKKLQIHGFCDASVTGYGACIYIRSINAQEEIQCRLFCTKSNVAPVKYVSIARLELCRAMLLARLYQSIKETIKIPVEKIKFWSDSMITLHWINKPSNVLKTFVANRVPEIQSSSEGVTWRHVPGESNPADALSRGEMPADFIINDLWKVGPPWLSIPEDKWPASKLTEPAEDPEAKRVTCMAAASNAFNLLERYQSIHKLKRIIAYLLRFKVSNKKFRGPLQLEELVYAEQIIMRCVQKKAFPSELRQLRERKEVDRKSKLSRLHPFLDPNGIIRVGGRLRSENIPYSQKHPVVLPKKEFISELIIKNVHKEQAHAGAQATLYAIRCSYWLLDGRNEVRRLIQNCVTCAKVNPPTVDYIMGDLPQTRVTKARPFLNVGVDYYGPFIQVKAYVAVFICLVSKAVHLELVSDMTTSGFIVSLRRFIARRGRCYLIQSDNGSNFVGARNEFKELLDTLKAEGHNSKVSMYLNEEGIKWRFIPPASPHFGGIVEAAVRSFKHHLKRVAGNELFTFEEMDTLVTEIKAILNSRSLTPISPDPNDLLVLTPGHLLIGEPLTAIPEQDLTDVSNNRLSNWEHIKIRESVSAKLTF
ncbi:uncharacterized protein LOC135164492 [Diachasmimorpha longicaudata]|uniref:uncharacterized protein LOC135164492 n=1 Tax=Diachasmimorpha longicaudata TaxID=58733 RepID=UPI0030B89B78